MACLGDRLNNQAVLVVSSGLHGVEGFLGAAVQQAMLADDALVDAWPRGVSIVLVHALNPYGFAWVRRVNESNVDLNRNFLLAGDAYRGSPARYAALDGLLNPKWPPRRFDPFRLRALLSIVRFGMPELKQAIAGGQFDFPQGLFFGGHEPAPTHRLLAEHLPRWIGQARTVVHLDFHSGLGRRGTYQLLIEPGLGPTRFAWLRQHFGELVHHSYADDSIAYQTRGGLGTWCRALRGPGLRGDLHRTGHVSAASCPGGAAGREPGPFLEPAG